jgi:hypothetical protein
MGGALLSGLLNGLKGIVTGELDIGKAIYDAFAGFVNSNLIDPIKGFGFSIFGHGIHPFSSLPDIPILHSGGTFWSGNAAGEGLALLRDGERVLTPEQSQGYHHGGMTVVNNLPAGVDPLVVVAASRRYQMRNGTGAIA